MHIEIGQTSSWLADQWVSPLWVFFLFILADPCTDKLVTGEEADASYLITPTTRLVWLSSLSEPLRVLQSPAQAAQLETTAEMPPASPLTTHATRKHEKDDLNLKRCVYTAQCPAYQFQVTN